MAEHKSIEPVLKLLGLSAAAGQLKISGVAYDSRQVQPGYAFVCLEGLQVDGNQFIDQAIAAGASCIFSTRPGQALSVPYFLVDDARLALAIISDFYFGSPSSKLRPLGVTGTNGKTTTTHLVEHVLNFAGHKTGLIGTLGSRWPGQAYRETKHTTPQAADLHRILALMADAGCSHVAMEVSSHALSQKRVGLCRFALACLTNITQDHLDFHQTMEHYWSAKRKLFEELNESPHQGKTAVVNLDDPLAEQFLAVLSAPVKKLTYGLSRKADIYVRQAKFQSGFTNLSIATPTGAADFMLNLTGRFNVYNCLAALGICLAEGVELKTCAEALGQFSGVAGRFEVISTGAPDEPLVIVDYAHTPDGLENVLRTARDLVPAGGKLIGVFGCGGDRDSSKRPQMGSIAESICDQVVITSDNPRSEDPQQIIVDILAGIKRLKNIVVEPDRASAIRLALKLAGSADVVMVAGKGHENYQILANRTIPFDDRTEVRLALNELATHRLDLLKDN